MINDLISQLRTLPPADRWQALDAIIDEQKKLCARTDEMVDAWEVERIEYQTKIDAYRDALESLKADVRRMEKATSQLKASPDAWVVQAEGGAIIYWTHKNEEQAQRTAEGFARPLIPLVRVDRLGVP